MDQRENSVLKQLKENAKRETPKLIFGMAMFEFHEWRWMYITGGLFAFGLWCVYGGGLEAFVR